MSTINNRMGYLGGSMDTGDRSTGTFSIFTRVLNRFEVMFHVSTYIPFHDADAQQVNHANHANLASTHVGARKRG